MKIFVKYIILSICLAGILTACVKDDTVGFVKEMNKVKIHCTQFNLASGDHYYWSGPVATYGEAFSLSMDSVTIITPEGEQVRLFDNNDYGYKFEWWLAIDREHGLGKKIGDKLDLEIEEFLEKPLSYESISFVVHDTITGLKYFDSHFLTINSALGNGLIVVDTKDEVNSNFNEVASEAFCSGYMGDLKIYRNTYESMRGVKYNGLVEDIVYFKNDDPLDKHVLAIIGESGLNIVDGNFDKVADNEEAFIVVPESLQNMKLINNSVEWGEKLLLLNGGMIHGMSESKFGVQYLLPAPKMDDYDITHFSGKYYSWYSGPNVAWDNTGNRFLKVSDNGTNLVRMQSTDATPAFDLNNVGDFDCLFMGRTYMGDSEGSYNLAVLKSETGSQYYAYIFQIKMTWDPVAWVDRETISNTKIVDLNSCTDIAEATSFVSCNNQNILYYTVGNKIYSVGIDTDVASSVVAYETEDPNDKFTRAFYWLKGGSAGKDPVVNITDFNNPTGPPVKIESQYRMIVTSTYNSSTGEGKVIALPIAIEGDINNSIEKNRNNHVVVGGFGRILGLSDIK